MSKRFLFLLTGIMSATVFTISCYQSKGYDCDYIEIINNSEHNITWMIVINAKTGYAVRSEMGNELIAKNGGTKSFKASTEYIVCLKPEDNLELMCSPTLKFYCADDYIGKITITLIWNGSDDPNWQPQK